MSISRVTTTLAHHQIGLGETDLDIRPLLELANYHVLGRILYYVPYNSPLHPGRVLSTFTFLSGVVEALSGCGASFTANPYLSRSQPNVGPGLMKTALLLQIVVAMCFIALAVTFHRRCLRSRIRSRKVQAPLLTLYISTGIITIRTIYRTVEYFSIANLKITPGFNPSSISPVVRYEWFFYVFEATLMLVNCVLLNVRHPRRWLPESNKTYLAQDGVTELEGPGWIDTRPLIMTVLDPFDLAGTIKGKSSMSNRFWENNGFDNPGNGVETGKQEPQTV